MKFLTLALCLCMQVIKQETDTYEPAIRKVVIFIWLRGHRLHHHGRMSGFYVFIIFIPCPFAPIECLNFSLGDEISLALATAHHHTREKKLPAKGHPVSVIFPSTLKGASFSFIITLDVSGEHQQPLS